MNKTIWMVIVSLIVLNGSMAHTAIAARVKKVELTAGLNDKNQISTPIFDGRQTGLIVFEPLKSAYNRNANILRRTGRTFATTGGMNAILDPSIELNILLTKALLVETSNLGFNVTWEGDGEWRISGTLNDIYFENQSWGWFPHMVTNFYGYMDVTLVVKHKNHEQIEMRIVLHNLIGDYQYAGSPTRQARFAIPAFLIDSAQEIISQLNRQHFKAPLHKSMDSRMKAVGAYGYGYQESELWAVGLSGSMNAESVLLSLLESVKKETERREIFNAIANLRSEETCKKLMKIYSSESHDCRYCILKSLDYHGGVEAMDFIKNEGLSDRDDSCQHLAERILRRN